MLSVYILRERCFDLKYRYAAKTRMPRARAPRVTPSQMPVFAEELRPGDAVGEADGEVDVDCVEEETADKSV